ncbi:MAG: hypothetical protein QOF41_3159 [Methylobacteriaceae bacterium]|nr:hypothetical protein [Methylobacteriaceae bacterium]
MAQLPLFPSLPDHPAPEFLFKNIRNPVWTENKARLVANYLRYFVYITKHGCYIDGFAGPRTPDVADSWAAKLVVESEPKFLRDFYLCDLDSRKVERLEDLRDHQPHVPKRSINILEGDFNNLVHAILASGNITLSTATFCLIDQFTAECHWRTVEALARHKAGTNKIEIFYFLASGWLDRALSGFTRNIQIPELWWGRSDWHALRQLKSLNRALLLCDRFKKELGYKFAHPWAIMERSDGGRVMFHMIHATDHAEAPKLMARAYRNANLPPDAREQLNFALEEFSGLADAYRST